jgi:hypothetical protein
MIIGEIKDSGGTPVALQTCGDEWCSDVKSSKKNPTLTRLGFCSWCWATIKNETNN